MTFLVICGFIWVYERLSQPVAVTAPERIEVRSDGRTLYLTPAEILYAEAVGNYIELYLTASAKSACRLTVLSASIASACSIAAICVVLPPSGDLRITLTDGRELTGSRRFRERLEF
jgi:hypothetical protein